MTYARGFCTVYRSLEGDESVEINGWLSREEALEVIRESTVEHDR